MDLVKSNLWSQDDYQPPQPSSCEKGEFFFPRRSPWVFSPFPSAPERCLGPGWQKGVILIIQQRCWEQKKLDWDKYDQHGGLGRTWRQWWIRQRWTACTEEQNLLCQMMPENLHPLQCPCSGGLLCELVTHWEVNRAMNDLEKVNEGDMRRRKVSLLSVWDSWCCYSSCSPALWL